MCGCTDTRESQLTGNAPILRVIAKSRKEGRD